jgi:RNA polymerase sigma factor (sigma-70 family)
VGFRRLSDIELKRLADEEVVAYLVRAREVGEHNEVTAALQSLVYGRMDLVESIVAARVPDQAIDRVAQDAMIETMTAVFDGVSVGQFVNFLKTVTSRKVADYWKSRGRHGREEATLDSDDESKRRREVVDVAEEVEAVPLQTLVDDVLNGLPSDHRAAVELAVFGDQPSADVAAQLGLTAANVDQIKSRFRHALRKALEDSDTG